MSILFNSQSWTHITQTQIKDLRRIQLKYLKRMLQAPDGTPNCITFLELGILPIEFEIHKRQLVFLHHIVHLDPSEYILQLYHQQLLFQFEHNWANNTKLLLHKYNLQHIDPLSKSREEWKLTVASAIQNAAFHELKVESSKHTKSYLLQYDTFELQEYLYTCPVDIASFIFRLRARILNCKNNHHKSHLNLTCSACHIEIETQKHIINCRKVFPNESHLLIEQFLQKNFDTNHTFVRRIMDRYKTFHQKKNHKVH